jgi:excisionase family DNA binding protein
LPARIFSELGVTPEQVEAYVESAARTPGLSVDERLYSPEEVAEYLGVHVKTVRSWIRSGKLPASRLAGQRALRVRASDLARVLEPVQAGEDDE